MLNLHNPQDKSATWDEPIEMLYACHGKVKRFCGQLARLPEYVAQHGCDDVVRESVARILTYFNQAAPLHHDDEECDFFPLLAEHAPQSHEWIATLAAEHDVLEQHWRILAAELNAVLSGDVAALRDESVANFTQSYAQHIELEEPLFEMGKRCIPENKLREIGKIMAQRRLS